MESNFTFIKDILPEAYNTAWGLEQDIIKGIPSHGDDIGHFLELIAVDMVNTKIKKITKRNITFRECIGKLRDNNPTIISRAFYDKLGDAYDLRNKCIHTDKETNTIFKPKQKFYVDLLKDLFYIAVFYYRVVKDKDFPSPEYVAPYNLDRLKFENLDEEGRHKLDTVFKAIQEGDLPDSFIESYFSKESNDTENIISEESKIIETAGLKDEIEVSDVECGIIVDDSDKENKARVPISLDDFSKFLKAIKISSNEQILKKCLVCGNETEDSNICSDCLKKIYFLSTLKVIYRNFNYDSFDKKDLMNLGFSENDIHELIKILKDYSLINESKGKFVFNKNKVDNFLYYENVVDIEDLFVSFYNGDLSSKEISESNFYHLGKEGNKIFNRFYVVSSNIKFNRYIKDLTEDINPEEAEKRNFVSNEEIVQWYEKRINRFIQTKEDSNEENTNFIQKFILITEVLMNKWLALRNENLAKNEVNEKLGFSKDITNFWFKKAEQYNFNEEYEIFDNFSLQKEITDMLLIVKSISDDKSREEIANDANVKLSELNAYYELGMKKINPYASFYNDFKNNYVYKRISMYIDNLKNNLKSSEAQIQTKISSEELHDWYNQGKIDFITADPKTERFINFFFIRTIILSNRWINLRKEGYSLEEASREIEISSAEVKEWLEFGKNKQYENLDGYQLFNNLFLSNQEIIIESVINSLNEGKTLEEAAAKENLTVEDLDGFYELGRELSDDEIDIYENTFYDEDEEIYTLNSSENDRKPYDKYFDYIKNIYLPKKRFEYLKLISEGNSKENAAQLCQFDIEDIDSWYIRGKQGEIEYADFYNKYLKIKINNYADELIKGKSRNVSLKSSDLEENEILEIEEDINNYVLKKRMAIVLKEISLGKNSAKIAKKLKIDQSLIFQWFEKGLNGERDYIDFYKEYNENYVSPRCELISSLFAKGLNKNKTVKRMRKEDIDIDIEDINHWQEIGLLLDEKEYKNLKKDKSSSSENIGEGIEVEDIGDIKEIVTVNLINNICLFDNKIGLDVKEDDCAEFKVRFNYEDLKDIPKISYDIKFADENFVEIDYSKRVRNAYLSILSLEDFDDYENIWYLVIKKTEEPDFDISSIIKKDHELNAEDKVSIFDMELENTSLSDEFDYNSEENSSSDEFDFTSEEIYGSDPLDFLEDYDYKEDELEDDEEKEKDYQLVSKFIDELGKEEDFYGGFIDVDVAEPAVENVTEKPIKEDTSIESDKFNQKIISIFEDKIINKGLVKSIKEEHNLPNYVIEFLIDKFSNDESINDSILKVLRYSFTSLPKPKSFEVVDKVSVSLFYKANTYLAKFNNLGFKLEIDPSYPFQYEKLLSGNVWAYVKLSNDGKLHINDLEVIEAPYFSLDEITDNRKEFTKEEWIDLLITSCGINPKKISYETKLLLIMRMIPFVEKNVYVCDLSGKESLKDNFYKNTFFNNSQMNESLYGLFYNQQKHKKGAISYFDSISLNNFANITDLNKKDNLMEFMLKKDKFNKDNYNDTSLIFIENDKDHIIDFIKGSDKSNKLVNSILCDEKFLESIHYIISSADNREFNGLNQKNFLSEDFGFNDIILSEYFHKLRDLNKKDAFEKYFKLSKGLNIKDVNAIKLMSSALIKILYPDNIYDKEDIREVLEISLKSRKNIKKILKQDIELSYLDLESSKETFV